jgi:UDP-glucose:(heptosyl)LPS alpha-1,3-glucosyltransferase|tara:strand:- start:4723 stop:5850 length:1128 start_codon:yes stop_codon:yes gene_type:complete
MQLSFLIYSYFPFGGLQRDFLRVATECMSRGHSITVYTLSWDGNIPDGMNVILVPVTARNRIKRNEAYTEWVLAALKLRDTSLVIGFNKMPFLDIYFAADPCFMERATEQRGFYYKFTSRYKHFRQYEEAVFAATRLTEVLILSPHQRTAFEKYYPGCESRLHQVPPGISVDRKVDAIDKKIATQLRIELGLATTTKLLLQVGSGFRVKGVDRALRAMAALPKSELENCHYLLIGQDSPDRYLRLARKLGIAKQFTVLGGRDDIPRFLAAADLLLHPAYSESAGYMLLEATIAGLPVLTTSTCGYSFHIEQAKSGLVCSGPFEQSQLNSYLAEMLGNLDTADWSKNGLEYGRQDELYSQASAVADFLEELLARKA